MIDMLHVKFVLVDISGKWTVMALIVYSCVFRATAAAAELGAEDSAAAEGD